MKKQLIYAGPLFLAIVVFGFRGTLLTDPLSVQAAGTEPIASVTTESASPSPAGSRDDQGPPGLMTEADQWITALSKQAPYAEWAQAEKNVYPLGPGTHSWLVTLRANGKELGYLIVAATPDGNGFSLVEYGTGEKSLYSMTTLYQSLIRHEIIDPHMSYDAFVQDKETIGKTRLYLGPLNTFWKITIRNDSLYFDAKSGELLPPIDEQTASAQDAASAAAAEKAKGMKTLTKVASAPAFDPLANLSWVKKDAASAATPGELMQSIDRQRPLTFTAKLRNGKLTYPFAVTGYDVWNDGTAFIKLDQEGDRTVPYEALSAIGRFTY